MFTKKRLICILSMAAALTAVTVTVPKTNTIFAAEQQDSVTYSYHNKRQTKQQDTYIGAASLNGKWANFTTISGSTMEKRMQEIIAFLNETHEKTRERFIITEGISQSEVTNMAGHAYLYDNSELYRELVSGDTITIASEGSFNLVADKDNAPLCERYVFYTDDVSGFTLNTRYSLRQSKLALYVISSDGEILYHHDATDRFDQVINLNLNKGLYSIILEYYPENGVVEGTKNICGYLD